MTNKNQEEKLATLSQTIEPVDIARRMLVWKWILDSKGITPPSDLTKEELVEVYYLCRESLSKFNDALNRVGQMQDRVRIL